MRQVIIRGGRGRARLLLQVGVGEGRAPTITVPKAAACRLGQATTHEEGNPPSETDLKTEIGSQHLNEFGNPAREIKRTRLATTGYRDGTLIDIVLWRLKKLRIWTAR
jgi:hypothetical protein